MLISLQLRAQAEQVRRRRYHEQKHEELTFDSWLQQASPEYSWRAPHLVRVSERLEAMARGELDRLMIFEPPRHGKSQLATVRYPVWRLLRDPALSVIVGCYNKTLAESFSRQSRRLARTFLRLDEERQAVDEWQTLRGGIFRAAGVGTGVTGKGAKLIVIDDPVKSRAEANSFTYREGVWNWYKDDLYTRLEPGGAIVLIMTRWHEDDLAGRILDSEDAAAWEVISLPALAEEGDPLGRAPGDALWPERFDETDLERIRTVLGTPSFTALYQQRPTPPEGGMFQLHWFGIVGAAPRQAQRVRYWDKAGSSGKGDYTCGLLMAKDVQDQFYIEDVVRGQWSALERETVIRQTAQADGHTVTIWQEQEPGSGGLESAQATTRNLAGFVIRSERVTGDKETRAMPFAAQCEAKNVKLVAGAWNAAYLAELTSFPYGAHDDQIDSSSGSFNKLAQPPPENNIPPSGGKRSFR